MACPLRLPASADRRWRPAGGRRRGGPDRLAPAHWRPNFTSAKPVAAPPHAPLSASLCTPVPPHARHNRQRAATPSVCRVPQAPAAALVFQGGIAKPGGGSGRGYGRLGQAPGSETPRKPRGQRKANPGRGPRGSECFLGEKTEASAGNPVIWTRSNPPRGVNFCVVHGGCPVPGAIFFY